MSASPTDITAGLSADSLAILDAIETSSAAPRPSAPPPPVQKAEAPPAAEPALGEPAAEQSVEAPTEPSTEESKTAAKPYDYKTALADLTKTLADEAEVEAITALPPQEAVAKLGEIVTAQRDQLAELEAVAESAPFVFDAPPDQWDVDAQIGNILKPGDSTLDPYYDKLVEHVIADHGAEGFAERIVNGQLRQDEFPHIEAIARTMFPYQLQAVGLTVPEFVYLVEQYRAGTIAKPDGSVPQYTTPGQQIQQQFAQSFLPQQQQQYVPPSQSFADKLVNVEGYAPDHPLVIDARRAAQLEMSQYVQQQQRLDAQQREIEQIRTAQETAATQQRTLTESQAGQQVDTRLTKELEGYLGKRTLPSGYDKDAARMKRDAREALDSDPASQALRSQLEAYYRSGTQNTPMAQRKLLAYTAAIDSVVGPIVDEYMERIAEIESARKSKSESAKPSAQRPVRAETAKTTPPPASQQPVRAPNPLLRSTNLNDDWVGQRIAQWNDMEASGQMVRTGIPDR